jgi:DNA repair protein SbcC/Rad50
VYCIPPNPDIEILKAKIHENQINLESVEVDIITYSKRYSVTNDKIIELKENLKSREDLETEENRIQAELKSFEEKQKDLSNIISHIPILQQQLTGVENQIKSHIVSKNAKEIDLSGHKLFLDENSDLTPPTDKTNEQLRDEQLKLDDLINKEEVNNGNLQQRAENYRMLMEKGECPTCGSKVNKDFESKVQHLITENKRIVSKINQYKKQKRKCIENIEKLNEYHSKTKEIEHHRSLYEIVMNEILGYSTSITQLEQQKQDINNDMLSIKKKSGGYNELQNFIVNLEQKKQDVERQQQIHNELDILEKSRTDIERDLNKLKTQKERFYDIINKLNFEKTQKEIELSPLTSLKSSLLELKNKLDSLRIQHSELSKEVVKSKTSYMENKEKLKRDVFENKEKLDKKRILDEYLHWIDQYYLPSIVNIENHVLELLRRRFDDHFQDWFEILVDDPSLMVNVDESFSPRITRNTNVQDYAQLSGGERTSIALAYRLALNSIVREVSFDKPVDLLILDEPTEGFSKSNCSN